MSMDDVRRPVKRFDELTTGTGKESESLGVVVVVLAVPLVESRSAKVLIVFDEKDGCGRLRECGLVDRAPLFTVTEGNSHRINDAPDGPFVAIDAPMKGQDDPDIMSPTTEFERERADDIGQAAGLDEGVDFGRTLKNFHVASFLLDNSRHPTRSLEQARGQWPVGSITEGGKRQRNPDSHMMVP